MARIRSGEYAFIHSQKSLAGHDDPRDCKSILGILGSVPGVTSYKQNTFSGGSAVRREPKVTFQREISQSWVVPWNLQDYGLIGRYLKLLWRLLYTVNIFACWESCTECLIKN